MLPSYAHSLTFLLSIVSLVGCVSRIDYNFPLSLGFLYLSYKYQFLSRSLTLIALLSGSVLIDIITLFLSLSQKDQFGFRFIPIFQIIIKVAIIYTTKHSQINSKSQRQIPS